MNSPLVASLNGASFSGDLRLDPIGRRPLVGGQCCARRQGAGGRGKRTARPTPHVSSVRWGPQKGWVKIFPMTNALKHCRGCERDLPRTSEFFYSKSGAQFRPSSRCRPCTIARSLSRYHASDKGREAKARMDERKARWAERAGTLERGADGRLLRSRRLEPAEARLRLGLATRLGRFRKSSGLPSDITPEEAVGCSWPEFVSHLERQWRDGMSWTNYGSWHIDHIVPISSADLTDRGQALAIFNFKNTRPLWGHENQKKGARLMSPDEASQ